MGVMDRILRWFEQRIDPFVVLDHYEPPNRLGPFMWFYVCQARGVFLTFAFFCMIAAVIEAMMMVFLGSIVDILNAFAKSPDFDQGWSALWASNLWAFVVMILVALVGRAVIMTTYTLFEQQSIVPSFFTLLRWQAHRHVVRQSLGWFQNDLAGRITQKVMQLGQSLGDVMIALLHSIWYISFYAVTTSIILGMLHWALALFVLIWVCAFFAIARYYVPRVREHSRRTAEAYSVLSGRLVDGYTNITTVKLYGVDDGVKQGVRPDFEVTFQTLQRFTRYIGGVRISLSVLSSVMIGLFAWLVIDLWLRSQVTIGDVAYSLALVLRLNQLQGRLMTQINALFRGIGTVQNSMDTIAQPIALLDAPDARELQFEQGQVTYDAVDFHYGGDNQIIKDFSLFIQPGERIGLVGPSGAGKSTLIKLLLRFYDPEAGKITLDGQDIKTVTQESLRRQFALVEQETALFQRSVFDNIAYGRPGATRDAVEAAAKRAEADQFIAQLTDGRGRTDYDAHVGERGVKLSGGQRQRIALARVFLRDAPILVLDEATSALDSEVEAVIQENLFELMEGKTVIAIAHRLSTISHMDRLVVIDEGKIVEEGSHDQLLANGGLYAQLWARQSGGYIGDG